MVQAELIESLISRADVRSLAPAEVLCRENEESHDAFVVLEGQVEAIIGQPDGTDGLVVARHGSGALIGEVTALIGGYRTATLRAVGPTSVAVIAAEALTEVFDQQPEAAAEAIHRARERTDRTRVAALLAEELQVSDRAVVAAIAEVVTWTVLTPGERLFAADEIADAAYLVISGRLESRTDDGRAPQDIGRGEIVGELGLLDGRPRAMTVDAVRHSMLARLSAEAFTRLSGDFSGLSMGLVRRVIDRSLGVARRQTPARSVAVVVTANIDDRVTCTRMVETLSGHGSTLHLSAAEVDRRLRQPGIAQTKPGGFGETRLAELIHHAESDFDHLLLEAAPADHQWVARSFRYADQVVLITSPDPGEDEHATIRGLRARVPENVPVWLALHHPTGTDRPDGSAALRERYHADEIHHLRQANRGDLSRLARLSAGRGTALVLSGGGARGYAHLGVVKALEEFDVPIDRIVGSSMGAVIAAGLAQDVPPDQRVAVIASQVDKLLDYTLPVVSLLRGKRISTALTKQFGDWDIEDLWIRFACITTNLTTSQALEMRTGPTHFAVRASVAIPGVLPPVPYGDDLLIDGGVLDNLPVSLVESDPSIGTIIASDVTPPRGPRARQDYGLSVSGWAALRSRFGRSKKGFPGLGAVLMRSTLMASSRDRDRSLQRGAIDLHLDLDLRGVGLLDFEAVASVAERGYEAARDRVQRWAASPAGTQAPPLTANRAEGDTSRSSGVEEEGTIDAAVDAP